MCTYGLERARQHPLRPDLLESCAGNKSLIRDLGEHTPLCMVSQIEI